MSEKIVNRVVSSGLITIDLSDYAPKDNIFEFDLKDFLFEGAILKEKDFRASLKEFDFSKYNDKIVALFCSTDAIVPMWSYMLVSSYLNPICSRIYFGEKEDVFQSITLENIKAIKASEFHNKKVLVKGCGSVPLNESLYIAVTQKLQNSVRSLMFGEACSAVAVYKKNK